MLCAEDCAPSPASERSIEDKGTPRVYVSLALVGLPESLYQQFTNDATDSRSQLLTNGWILLNTVQGICWIQADQRQIDWVESFPSNVNTIGGVGLITGKSTCLNDGESISIFLVRIPTKLSI